ncbi:MAG: hypothetical protein JWQ90_3518 [Hydrocarboniphaga sp.]|uniref:hypothetical protein n=1 Tax=Hydrocarboniphaga sp. TaxID=2033016 RepID=UPI002608358C|nr:hypothetical protein [Hydrocarboniphaga sp.]MDB5971068.1 hypothetical protein [Hydrocarboniphaga sp.]
MNRIAFFCVSAVLLAGSSIAAASETASAPAQYGDRQVGSFGDIDQGNFGNTAAGNFIENNFPRAQEGQMRPVYAVPTRASQSIFRKPLAPAESPYVTLPAPADAKP